MDGFDIIQRNSQKYAIRGLKNEAGNILKEGEGLESMLDYCYKYKLSRENSILGHKINNQEIELDNWAIFDKK